MKKSLNSKNNPPPFSFVFFVNIYSCQVLLEKNLANIKCYFPLREKPHPTKIIYSCQVLLEKNLANIKCYFPLREKPQLQMRHMRIYVVFP